MQQTDELILEPILLGAKPKRIDLLPWWMQACCWLFLFSSLFVVFCILASFFNISVSLGFYGLEANTIFSSYGLLITAVLILKAFVSYGLWWEKDWGIHLAFIDAIAGLVICSVVMLLPFITPTEGIVFSFRLEFILLFFYLRKLIAIQPQWVNQ